MAKLKIAMALQGGGSHGAFTWGVMEKLLEEDLFDFRGFCGTSAGAINSAIVVHGIQKNGNAGAIQLLEEFWRRVSGVSNFITPTWVDNHLLNGNLDFSPIFQTCNFWKNYLSPYQFNPFNINPLGDIISELIDFDELQKSNIKLYVSATNILSGSCKVFCTSDITANMLLASAAMPDVFQSVEVDGEHYWDGGFTGNPPIYPLIYGTDSKDVLLIQLNPIWSKTIPKNVSDIIDRVNEITFNESLKAQMRMLMQGNELAEESNKSHFHSISANNYLDNLAYSSKMNTSWEFLNNLRAVGRMAAEKWIADELQFVGKKTSDKINKMFGSIEDEWTHENVQKPADHLKECPIGKNKNEVVYT